MSEDSVFKVLLNAEQQYSLWPATLAVPPGWSETDIIGSREECIKYVDTVWTDLRPLSLRKAMAAADGN